MFWRKQSKPPLSFQQSGQSGNGNAKLDSTFLRGGPLQKDLEQAQPQEFLEEETSANVPGYKTRSFTVHSGKIISFTLINRSTVNQQHDWVLALPGTQQKVMQEAKAAGPEWQWIPQSPDILAFVPLTPPGGTHTILFRAPAVGDYPFLCTYPGHGEVMNGILHVVE